MNEERKKCTYFDTKLTLLFTKLQTELMDHDPPGGLDSIPQLNSNLSYLSHITVSILK